MSYQSRDMGIVVVINNVNTIPVRVREITLRSEYTWWIYCENPNDTSYRDKNKFVWKIWLPSCQLLISMYVQTCSDTSHIEFSLAGTSLSSLEMAMLA